MSNSTCKAKKVLHKKLKKIHFFGVIVNLFQVYDDPHQMLREKNYLG